MFLRIGSTLIAPTANHIEICSTAYTYTVLLVGHALLARTQHVVLVVLIRPLSLSLLSITHTLL